MDLEGFDDDVFAIPVGGCIADGGSGETASTSVGWLRFATCPVVASVGSANNSESSCSVVAVEVFPFGRDGVADIHAAALTGSSSSTSIH